MTQLNLHRAELPQLPESVETARARMNMCIQALRYFEHTEASTLFYHEFDSATPVPLLESEVVTRWYGKLEFYKYRWLEAIRDLANGGAK